MNTTKSKENVLKKIRAALIETTPIPFKNSEGNSNLFEAPHDDLAVIFAEEFTKLDGRFIYVDNNTELTKTILALLQKLQLEKIYCAEPELENTFTNNNWQWPMYEDLATCDVSITTCECVVARTGTIVLSSALPQGRTASVYAPIHICVAYASQMLYDTKDALLQLKEKYNNQLPSFITFATGPSRTADIEKTLVKGIHGPKEVFCILVENNQ
jgi:L-lactate dehydrogenase complex protein LldG